MKMIHDRRVETPVINVSRRRGEVKAACTFRARQSAHSFSPARNGRATDEVEPNDGDDTATALALYDALEDSRPVRLLGVRAEMTTPEAAVGRG